MSLEEYTPVLLESLKNAKLAPGKADSLIPADFKPTTKLTITYGGRDVELGNLFRASECKTAPAVSFKPEVSDPEIIQRNAARKVRGRKAQMLILEPGVWVSTDWRA
jgi:hypothetical protein